MPTSGRDGFDGRMTASFARAAVRGHWRALVSLGALAAIAVAALVATLGAADRSRTAFDRLRRETVASDVAVFHDDAEGPAAVLGALRTIDGVTAAEVEAELFVRPAGTELFPNYNFLARAPQRAGGRVNVPVVVAGRLPDPARVREVAVSERLAGDLGLEVGDELPLESMTDAWVETAYTGGDAGPPDGPEVRTRVVGIVRSAADFGRVFGVLHLTPAFLSRYGDDLRTYRRVEVVAEPRALGPLRREFADVGERSVFGDDGSTEDALETIAAALRLLAAVVGIAGATVVTLAIARASRASLRDRESLVALGSTRRQLIAATFVSVVPFALVGAVLGGALGVWATPDAMVGLAARIDPTATRTGVDWPIVLGAVGGVVVLAGAAVVVVVRSARVATARGRPPVAIVRLDRPLPLVLGLRQAVTGESAMGGRTSRAALAVGILGLAGVVAALTVSGSIVRLRSDPYLFGSGGTARSVDSGESVEVLEALMPRLAADRRVSALEGLHISFDARVEGREVTLVAIDRRRGSVDASVVEGRVPRTRDEVALGPATLERVGAEVGERVVMDGPDGEATYRVVGSILFPEGDFTFDDGAAMTLAGADPIVGDARETAAIHSVLFDWGDDVDAGRADRELEAEGFRVFGDVGGVEPAKVTNLGQVSELPTYLAVFLGVLALATLGHALATGSRRRVREQATLRALGLTSRAGAAVVAVQAAVVAVLALGIGIPLGLLVGSRIWTSIAEHAHVVVRTVLPTGWVAMVVGATVVGVGLVAAVPVVRTRRIRPAQALRAE